MCVTFSFLRAYQSYHRHRGHGQLNDSWVWCEHGHEWPAKNPQAESEARLREEGLSSKGDWSKRELRFTRFTKAFSQDV